MKLKELLTDDDAVSPVIGVILMVAITVILAAVIATFVLGLGEQVSDTAPNANFQFDYDSGEENVTITHTSGPAIDASDLSVTGAYDGDENNWNDFLDEDIDQVSAGDSIVVPGDHGDGDLEQGETLSVVWSSEGESATLATFDVPSE